MENSKFDHTKILIWHIKIFVTSIVLKFKSQLYGILHIIQNIFKLSSKLKTLAELWLNEFWLKKKCFKLLFGLQNLQKFS